MAELLDFASWTPRPSSNGQKSRFLAVTDPAIEAAQESQQPSCLPLSSVLRFFSPSAPRTAPRKHPLSNRIPAGPPAKMAKLSNSKTVSPPPIITTTSNTGGTLHLSSLLVTSSKNVMGNSSVGGSSLGGSSVGTPSSTRESTPVSAVSNSPPVSDCEETLLSENEDSNDSWTTQDEIPADLIIKLASKGHTGSSGDDKPYVCPVVGCRKRYKNVNGIKYHAKNSHKKDSKVRKPYRCYCGKSYITNQGLKIHCSHSHKSETMTLMTTSTGEVLQVPSTQLTSSELVTGQLSQKSKLIGNDNEGNAQVGGVTMTSTSIPQVAVAGQIIKGGSTVISKGSSSLPSINLSGLVAAGGGKIAFKALSNGQLLLSQPLEGKLASIIKSDGSYDTLSDETRGGIVAVKADGYQHLEVKKLALPLATKSSQHQLAVTTSSLSLGGSSNPFNALKASHKTVSSNFLARALKSQLSSSLSTATAGLDSIGTQSDEGHLNGQGVILGVTMEEGTLIEDGDETLSELSVMD